MDVRWVLCEMRRGLAEFRRGRKRAKDATDERPTRDDVWEPRMGSGRVREFFVASDSWASRRATMMMDGTRLDGSGD